MLRETEKHSFQDNDSATVLLVISEQAAGECQGLISRVRSIRPRRPAESETKNAMFRHGVEPFEVGRDSISPVNADYKTKGSFPFNGRIEKITFEVTPKS
jgi:hypothetical protein